jgi:hypothetical protein
LVYFFFFAGTFAPFFRASESPIAMACLRLLTFPPLPPFPDFSVPFFRRRIALLTVFPAALPYFLPELFRDLELVGMEILLLVPLLKNVFQLWSSAMTQMGPRSGTRTHSLGATTSSTGSRHRFVTFLEVGARFSC